MHAEDERISLYHYDGCGFCTMVRLELQRLGVDVELRDVFEPEHRAALRQARGRTTVPVLRIERPEGQDTWMPESRDIVRWLRDRYERGEGAASSGG